MVFQTARATEPVVVAGRNQNGHRVGFDEYSTHECGRIRCDPFVFVDIPRKQDRMGIHGSGESQRFAQALPQVLPAHPTNLDRRPRERRVEVNVGERNYPHSSVGWLIRVDVGLSIGHTLERTYGV